MRSEDVARAEAGPAEVVIPLNPVTQRRLLLGLVCLAMLFFAATWLSVEFWLRNQGGWQDWPLVYRLLLQGNLAQENVLGAWFSSMLLLSAGLVFFLCFAAEPRGEARSVFRFGWLISGLVFVGLSLDELGSFHERIALWRPETAWWPMIAAFVLVVPAYMTGFGIVQQCRSGAGAVLLILGVICFTLIPVFEYFEIAGLNDAGTPLRSGHAVWAALEEGTELMGMIAFLAAALRFATAFAEGSAAASGRPYLRLRVRPRAVAGAHVLVVALAAIGAYASYWRLARFEATGVNGLPENWFVCAPIFVAGLIVLGLSQGRVHRRFGWALAGAALLVSALIGADIQRFFWNDAMVWLKWSFVGALGLPGLTVLMTQAALAVRMAALTAMAALVATVAAMPGPLALAIGLAAVLVMGGASFVLLRQPLARM